MAKQPVTANKTVKAQSQYQGNLLKSEKSKEQEQVGFMVEEQEQLLAGTILKTRQLIAGSNKTLSTLKDAYPLNPQAIIDEQINLEGLQDGLARLVALQEELF